MKRERPLSARLATQVRGRSGEGARLWTRRFGAPGSSGAGRRYAPPPEIVVERTNLGPEMDKLVAELKRRQKPIGVDADYDFLRENFDHLNFALQAQAKSRITPNDPIATYLRNGAPAINNPDINFSMRAYLDRYPEKREGRAHPYLAWLRHGREAGEIADPAPEIEKMA